MLVLLACLVFAGDPAEAPPPAPVAASVAASHTGTEWIDLVDAQVASLPGLRYSVERTTVRKGATVTERWRQVTWGKQFRIDYFGDTARQFTCDGNTLLQYVPANKAAQRVNLTGMSEAERVEYLSGIVAKVAVPGFRIGQANGVQWTVTDGPAGPDGGATVEMSGTGPDGSTLRNRIDPVKRAMLESEIVKDGRSILLVTATDLREVRTGVWLPHHVELAAPDEGGQVAVTLRLTKVVVLEEAPADAFDVTLDASIHVEDIP